MKTTATKPKTPPPRERCGFAELAAHLGRDSDYVRELVGDGKIPHLQPDPVNKVRLLRRADVNAWLEATGHPPLPPYREEN